MSKPARKRRPRITVSDVVELTEAYANLIVACEGVVVAAEILAARMPKFRDSLNELVALAQRATPVAKAAEPQTKKPARRRAEKSTVPKRLPPIPGGVKGAKP